MVEVEAPAGPEEVAALLRRVFGVQTVALATLRPFRQAEDLLRDGLELFRPAVLGKKFAVRVRRGEEASRQDFRSPDIERQLGALLFPHAAGVDLKKPEVETRIELHRGLACYSAVRQAGEGGLPIGTEGRALVLFSGGYDSAVAAFQLWRRGLRLDFFLANLGDRDHLARVAAVAKRLVDRWCFGDSPRLHVVDLRPWVAELEASCPPALWQVLLKRAMVRLAGQIARRHRLQALATGEVLGQVSSQTLANLAVIEKASELPVLRPLLTLAKEAILAEARRLGTAEASAQIPELCGLGARAPSTHAHLPEVLQAEALLGGEWLERLLGERERFDIRTFPEMPPASQPLTLETAPPDAQIYDLRARRTPPIERAQALPFAAAWQLIADGRLPGADPRPVVLVCELGLRSAYLAEQLRAKGHPAFSLRATLEDPLLRAATSPAWLG